MNYVQCDYCKKWFPKKPSAVRRSKNDFCSHKCHDLFQQKKNVFVIKEDYAELHITTKREEKPIVILIDKEDVEKINFTKWSLKYDKTVDNYYVYAWERNNYKNRKRIILHRFLVNCPNNLQVDHVNRDTKDNRKSNLKIVSQQENANNKGVYKNNRLGHRNIRKLGGRSKQYILEIKRNKKIVFKKYSRDLQELIQLRDKFLEAEKNGTQIKEQKEEYIQLKLDITE